MKQELRWVSSSGVAHNTREACQAAELAGMMDIGMEDVPPAIINRIVETLVIRLVERSPAVRELLAPAVGRPRKRKVKKEVA